MTIGERIKALRKKNDLTQEKLADYLSVSYQAVSKWECGMSNPDLSLIGPLTKLLHVSADELLGLIPEKIDERKAYFDAEYHQFWKKDDHEADLEIARKAVAEYPTDYRYLEWLATNEWYVGYSIKYCGTSTEKELLASSIRHYEMILEDFTDGEIRNKAIAGLVHVHKSKGQLDKAKKYALMYPDKFETTRDALLMLCVEGKEKEFLLKKAVRDGLNNLLISLEYLWMFLPEPCEEILDAKIAAINAVITDGNYQHFHITLSLIYMEKARIALHQNEHEKSIEAIIKAYHHARNFDEIDFKAIETYTCPVLRGYNIDRTNDRRTDWTLVGDMKRCLTEEQIFLPVYACKDIIAILNS